MCNELEWVNFLKKRVPKSKNVLVGIGDDCALVKVRGKQLLLKSDLFVENVHFKRRAIDYATIGMRAVSRVLSDFAACGGRPLFMGVSLGKPDNLQSQAMKKILGGILACSKKYNFSFIGGDTCTTPNLFLDVWGVGETARYIRRSTAKIGDYIFLTGPLGARPFTAAFEPRLKEGTFLAHNFAITSMIDVSDGFVLDLYRIIHDSGTGALLWRESLPLTHGARDLYRGEDYELIFTIDKSEPRLTELQKKFYCVGKITHKMYGYKIIKARKTKSIKIKGYTHF